MAFMEVFFLYVCPTIGSILSTIMFAAPVADLRKALHEGALGVLDPLPWVFAAGNCFGWILYGYLQWDPFLVASNLPGFLVSLWLNYGAAKLQYHRAQQERVARLAETALNPTQNWDASPPMDHDAEDILLESALTGHDSRAGNDRGSSIIGSHNDQEVFVFSPQETAFFRMMTAWAIIATYTSWFTDLGTASAIVGWTVNVNLVFFYGAPLNTIRTVVHTQDSTPIHRPTLTMNFINTSFWMLYGLARKNVIIVAPNATGFLLGVAQAVLCLFYPKGGNRRTVNGSVSPDTAVDEMIPEMVAQEEDDFV